MNFWTSFKVFVKGILMGVVNVVPVSSGTIALVLGVFERFINSIKSLNPKNFKYLFKGEITEFGRRTDFRFLVTILLGIIVGMVFTAIFLKRVLKSYEVFVWAFFIGLIIASVINVMKSIEKVTVKNVIILMIGFVVSFFLSIHLNPESNDGFWYLFICGIVGATGMVVPGISGSHLMLLMGNYEYVMIDAVNLLTTSPWEGIKIMIPVVIGAVVGLLAFAHLLSWIFKRFHDQTVALLSGFILGSLPIIWPWKTSVMNVLKDGTEKVVGYQWHWPAINGEFFIALVIMIVGAAIIILTESLATRQKK